MAEKKAKSDKPKIEIQTRKPEKRGIFANIGNDRDKNEHPLREILNFPEPQSLDSQEASIQISNNENIGYPIESSLDNQTLQLGKPTDTILEIQGQDTGYPAITSLDSQNKNNGNPINANLDSQGKNVGNPPLENLDILIAKPSKRISKETGVLDSKISKEENLDSPKPEKKVDWQKYDKKRSAKGVFLRTNDEITKKFKQFCIAQDWEFSEGTEIAWTRLMTDLDSQREGNLDSLIAQDDRRLKMLYKTRPFIINLYLRYTAVFNEISPGGGKNWSAKWLPRDDEAGVRYNDLSPSIIELGILQTQIQKGFGSSRIQTFKYYTEEIEKVLSSGVSDETLETILKYHRQLWKNQTGREVDLGFLEPDK